MFRGFGEEEVHCTSLTVPVKTQNGWLSQLKLDLKLNWKLRSHGTGWLPSFPRGKTPTPNCINTNKPTICIYEHRIGRLFFSNAHKTISMAWAWLHLSGLSLQLCCFVTHTKTLASVHVSTTSHITNHCPPWPESLREHSDISRKRLAEYEIACAFTFAERGECAAATRESQKLLQTEIQSITGMSWEDKVKGLTLYWLQRIRAKEEREWRFSAFSSDKCLSNSVFIPPALHCDKTKAPSHTTWKLGYLLSQK